MHIPLRTVDLVIVVLYLLGITWFGLRFRNKGERSIKSYFLADRNIPWWAISLSIVAAETSTLTIISVPGIAFTGDFGFLQLVFGFVNAPLFATFLLGMFWKRTTSHGAFFGLVGGTLTSMLFHGCTLSAGNGPGIKGGWIALKFPFRSEMGQNQAGVQFRLG